MANEGFIEFRQKNISAIAALPDIIHF